MKARETISFLRGRIRTFFFLSLFFLVFQRHSQRTFPHTANSHILKSIPENSGDCGVEAKGCHIVCRCLCLVLDFFSFFFLSLKALLSFFPPLFPIGMFFLQGREHSKRQKGIFEKGFCAQKQFLKNDRVFFLCLDVQIFLSSPFEKKFYSPFFLLHTSPSENRRTIGCLFLGNLGA